jgi:hypothetical protein
MSIFVVFYRLFILIIKKEANGLNPEALWFQQLARYTQANLTSKLLSFVDLAC